jgi:hypothetical protein
MAPAGALKRKGDGMKKQKTVKRLELQKETLLHLAGGYTYEQNRRTIQNTVYSTRPQGCEGVSHTCRSVCICDA